MADPTALQTAVAAAHAVALIGMPEGAHRARPGRRAPRHGAQVQRRLPSAINAAIADVRAGLAGAVPAHLRDAHYAGGEELGHGKGYVYPHDDPRRRRRRSSTRPTRWSARDYYRPTDRGFERELVARLATAARDRCAAAR